MEKTAKIVTYHRSNSYGACLQALATYAVFANRGYQTEFIDYINEYEHSSNNATVAQCLRSGNIKRSVAVGVQNALGASRYTKQAFEAFHQRLPKTQRTYSDIEQLSEICSDVLIAGSDQLWNPTISGGVDPVFFLQFGSTKLRISLATSMGNHVFTSKEARAVKEALSSFSAISVRERFAANQIEQIVDTPAYLCLDPTLLVPRAFWDELTQKPNQAPETDYLLVFTLKSWSQDEQNAWNHYADLLGIPSYRIINMKIPSKGNTTNLYGVTPEEFLWLFKHAAFICTDSFHGTVFSILFERPFITFPNCSGNNVRMEELLSLTELAERFDGLNGAHPSLKVDFSAARNALNARRTEASAWLDSALALME